jgi:chromosomal replication initiation ATPase DnaA
MRTEHQEQVVAIIKKAEAEIAQLTGMGCNIFYKLQSEISIDQVRHAIQEEMNIPWSQIAGKTKPLNIVIARYIYIRFMRNHFKRTFTSIAKDLNRDHTSIMQAMKTSTNLIGNNDYVICTPLYNIEKTLYHNEN